MKYYCFLFSYFNYFSYLCAENEGNMTDDNMVHLMISELSKLRDENIGFLEHDKVREEKMAAMRKKADDMSASMNLANRTFMKTIRDLNKKVDVLEEECRKKDEEIAALKSQLALHRGKRFAPTAEQARLLNGRMSDDDRDEEKDRFDGKSVSEESNSSVSNATGDEDASKKDELADKKPKSRKGLYSPEPDGEIRVDETIEHKLEDYYQLPKGARYMKRNGEIVTGYYTVIEYVKARVIRHVYEVASVIMPDDTIVETVKREHVVGSCPFDADMLAFILVEKYCYHSPINTVKRKLRDAGANFSKSTLGRYFHLGMQALTDLLRDTFYEEVQKAKYLMVDETAELVGVEDKDTGNRCYRKKYLWAFFDKVQKLVAYVYEEGSRSRKVVLDFLKNFSGCISTDGYVAYSVFDGGEQQPNVVRIGCWTHARRLFVEALETARPECTHVIGEIGELFGLELRAKVCEMDESERLIMRQTESVHILARLLAYVHTLSKDAFLMANPLLKKAVDYMINQWDALRNYIKFGLVEISNNLCEQRMKAIKLTLKNCQNIGSEPAAERAAFMHSLIESCSLNGVNPYEYLRCVFEKIQKGRTDNKKSLLPCFFRSDC